MWLAFLPSEDGEKEAGITVAKDMGHISESALILTKVGNGLLHSK